MRTVESNCLCLSVYPSSARTSTKWQVQIVTFSPKKSKNSVVGQGRPVDTLRHFPYIFSSCFRHNKLQVQLFRYRRTFMRALTYGAV